MKKQLGFYFLAVVLVLTIVAEIILWFMVRSGTANFEQAQQEYLRYYPSFLQNARLLTVISILMLTAAGLVFLNFTKIKSFKISSSILGMLCALLLMWMIWTLM